MNVFLAEQSPMVSPRRCLRSTRTSCGRTTPNTIVLPSNLLRLLQTAGSAHDNSRSIHLQAVAMREPRKGSGAADPSELIQRYRQLSLRSAAWGKRPGITGLCHFSSDKAFMIHENLQYNLYYIRNHSFFTDSAILLHTVVFAMRGLKFSKEGSCA